jgi:hypothetical protein
MALQTPDESTSHGYHLYNFSIESAGGGLVWSNLGLNLTSPSGGTIPITGAGWNITVFGLRGEIIAYYVADSGTSPWTVGGGVTVSNLQTLLLVSPPSTPLTGGSLTVFGVGSFAGSLSVSIP